MMAETADKSVWTEDAQVYDATSRGAAEFESVLVSLIENKSKSLHAKYHNKMKRKSLLLLLRKHTVEYPQDYDEYSPDSCKHISSVTKRWLERERKNHKRRKKSGLKLRGAVPRSQRIELVQQGGEVRAIKTHRASGKGGRRLLVSAIDEQRKVIQVLDPDELPRRARYTIMVTACLLLFLCLLLVGVTLRMAPLIDDMVKQENQRIMDNRVEIYTESSKHI